MRLHNFAPSLFNYMLQPDRDFDKCNLKELSDPTIRNKLCEIAEACGETEFKSKVLFLEERVDAGFNKASVSLVSSDQNQSRFLGNKTRFSTPTITWIVHNEKLINEINKDLEDPLRNEPENS